MNGEDPVANKKPCYLCDGPVYITPADEAKHPKDQPFVCRPCKGEGAAEGIEGPFPAMTITGGKYRYARKVSGVLQWSNDGETWT